MTTPSSGALRAAKAIEADHQFGRMEPQRLLDRAAIIDRETAAPELLAALRAVMDQLTHEGYVNQITGERALDAIAKAEGRA